MKRLKRIALFCRLAPRIILEWNPILFYRDDPVTKTWRITGVISRSLWY